MKKKPGCLIPLIIIFIFIILLFKGCASIMSSPELSTEPPQTDQAKLFITESLKYVEDSAGQLYVLELASQQYSTDGNLHEYKKSVEIKHEQIKNDWLNFSPADYNNKLLNDTKDLIKMHLFSNYEYSKNISLYLEKLDEKYYAKAVDSVTNAQYITYDQVIKLLKDVAIQSGMTDEEINELF